MLPTFAKREEIPSGFEDEYEEVDGEWRPVDHTASLQTALEKERAARKDAEAVARKAAKDASEAAAKKAAAESGMTDEKLKELYANVEQGLREEYEPKIAELDELRNENRKMKLNDKVIAMFREKGALPKHIDDFWKLYGDQFDLTSDGVPMVRDAPGKDVTKHVDAIMKERKDWVAGTRAGGGGGGGFNTTARTTGPTGLTFEDMMKNPQAAIAAANDG